MPWHLTWSDEFRGTALNVSWSLRTNQSHCCGPFGGKGELQLYLPDEVSVHDGLLGAAADAAHAASSRRRSIFCASSRRSFLRKLR